MGKYIKKFDTHSDYEDFIETEDFIRPNVSYCVDNKDVHYNSIQTLFALEILSGRFISFYFQNGVLYANTDDGSSAQWVCDENGIVIDNISIYGAERAPILEQINEHYDTSFTGWSDNEMGLRFGDTVPNWNAYEKILLPEMVNFRFVAGSGTANVTGFMQGDKAYLNSATESSAWNVSPEGQVWGGGGQASLYEQQAKTLILSNFGREISEVLPFVVEWQQGSQVPNWENYTLLS